MSKKTGISWTDATYNPWQGCQKISQGCAQCYMYAEKTRYGQDPAVVIRSQSHTFNAPLRWEREALRTGQPMRVFTCSWSDFFIEEADPWRDEAFTIMALTPHLTYQVLTKRPERMHAYLTDPGLHNRLELVAEAHNLGIPHPSYGKKRLLPSLPLTHIWLGVSCENQATADERIPWLLRTPAAVRFISYEPALEAVDFSRYLVSCPSCGKSHLGYCEDPQPCISWVIAGGESGSKARPCDLAWLRRVVQQCQAACVPVWVKQLGSHSIIEVYITDDAEHERYHTKQKAGSDPEEWPSDLRIQQFPEGTHHV